MYQQIVIVDDASERTTLLAQALRDSGYGDFLVAGRIRRALPHVDADKVIVAPDCGLKYLPRDVAFGKMKAMADGAAIVRREFA